MNRALAEPSDSTGSLTSRAYWQLRADIVSCRLKPDEKLVISALCESYKANSSAIREALSRLVSDGLAVSQVQKGFKVSPVSRGDLEDLTRTRIQIELLALRQSITLGDLAWESRVLGAFHQLSRTPDPRQDSTFEHVESWSRLHREFHRSLIAGCGSNWLLHFSATLSDQSERFRNLSGRLGYYTPRDLLAEHRALMEAALARDADAACEQMERHLSETTRILLELGDIASNGPSPASSRARPADSIARQDDPGSG